ncbi:P-loop containing nucleoside triphosphate hydrolase protein [Zopfochytrium polystomum]|nr:P-loop containing nucleoside triphosphate hydrolase protein [Zopfochytrium polystomum]
MEGAAADNIHSADRMEGVEEQDALEAYMIDVKTEVDKLREEDKKFAESGQLTMTSAAAVVDKGLTEAEEVVGDARVRGSDDEGDDSDEDILGGAAKKLAAKRKDLASVDHSVMNYEPFRKNFYIEPPELAQLTDAEVEIRRADLGGIKIRGVNCPKPIEKWAQMGLPPGVADVITKTLKYAKPTAIQSQAIPAVMSGRDVIGIAKTGSGKTIAFLLPMFRHIKDQRPLEIMEGPIALIMTPTHELAVQIHRECKPFMKVLNIRAVCAYGGSPIKDQIAELKRGAEIIICTPGRMIDLLCANSGRVTNLKRVTYLVLDEADRMFDMGFEPQVMKMVNNIRPSRQTILFSATFPRKMEALARKILKQPLEITVGGRSTVCADVHQIVEVRDETKFLRLLEILGLCMTQDPDTKVLIFVDTHEAADNLLRDLLNRSYLCQSVHGGKDQADRDSTISDFKSGDINIVIATSVAARGLDVKNLKVVINYECPNHMEDYVHRCGRTGRAGNKGTAYTFITPDQDKYAVDIVRALKMSNAEVPESLNELAEAFIQKVKEGKANYSSSGFGGKGLDRLDKDRDMVKHIQKKSHGTDYADEEEDAYTSDDETFKKVIVRKPGAAAAEASAKTAKSKEKSMKAVATAAAEQVAAMVAASGGAGTDPESLKNRIAAVNAKEGQKTAAAVIAQLNKLKSQAGTVRKNASDAAFALEIEINDFPEPARWKVNNKKQISQIAEVCNVAITARGSFFPPGKQPGPGERKLYLFVEGDTQFCVDRAAKEIKLILKEATMMAVESEAPSRSFGRYLVTNG